MWLACDRRLNRSLLRSLGWVRASRWLQPVLSSAARLSSCEYVRKLMKRKTQYFGQDRLPALPQQVDVLRPDPAYRVHAPDECAFLVQRANQLPTEAIDCDLRSWRDSESPLFSAPCLKYDVSSCRMRRGFRIPADPLTPAFRSGNPQSQDCSEHRVRLRPDLRSHRA
jgi:hypothetical protein